MENLTEKIKKTIIFLLLYFGAVTITFFIVDKDLAKILGISGLLIFSLQESFRYFLDKDLEIFKLKLDKERIKYDKLQTRKAEIVEEFYNLIVEFKFSLNKLNRPFQVQGENKEKYFNEVWSSLDNLNKKFEKRKLYFNEELEKEIKNLINVFYEFCSLSSYYENVHTMRDEENNKIRQLTIKEIKDGKERNNKIINQKAPIVLKSINREFKNILGS